MAQLNGRPESQDGFKYWAFISYSHTDKKWGDWLHRALETYRVPKRLIGQESRDGKVPPRVFPIFRDREELPVSADLGANINEALRQSRYLIVICSPRAATSRWVNEEILTFKRLGREDRILALIVAGEPNASDGKPGFSESDECFPPAMRFRLGSDGELSAIRTEPIAADVRPGMDGRQNAKLKLLAGLLAANYDELKQRENERRIRRLWSAVAVAAVLIACFAVLSLYALRQAQLAREQKTAAQLAQAHAENEKTRAETEKSHAEAERAHAETEKNRAETALIETRQTLSKSDFLQALHLIDEGKQLEALARLSRSLSVNPKNQAAACRLATLLAYGNYAGVVFRRRHNNPSDFGELSPDGMRIVTLSQNGRDPYDVWIGPDGTRIVTQSQNFAQVWDARNGQPLIGSFKHEGVVNSAHFSPDGKRIVTASQDGTVRVWDAQSGKPITDSLKHIGFVASARFSPDGRSIVADYANWDRIWDAQSGKLLIEPPDMDPHGSGDWMAKFSPDGRRIVVASQNSAQVWDLRRAKPLTNLMKHRDTVNQALFSPDGKRILTASDDGTARVWDAQTGKTITGPLKHNGRVWSANFSPDGKRIVTISSDCTARVWDAQTGEPLTGSLITGEICYSAEFSADGTLIMTSSQRKQVWDAKSGKPLTGLLEKAAKFTPDGKRIMVVTEGGIERVWDPRSAQPLIEPLSHGREMSIMPWRSASFSPDGTRIVTASDDGSARVWDSQSGRLLIKLLQLGSCSAEFSPDGKRIVTSDDGAARVWDAQSGKPLIDLMIHNDPVESAHFSPDEKIKYRQVTSAHFSPDGKRIVTASGDGTALVWNAQSGEALAEPMQHGSPVGWVQFSPNGQRIVTSSRGVMRLWDAQSGMLLTEDAKMKSEFIEGHAEFSFDGKWVLTESGLWDIGTGKAVRKLDSGGYHFSPDGKCFVTGSWDTTKILDTESGKVMTKPLDINGGGTAIAQFSPNGKWVVTASEDGTARVWDAESGSPLTERLEHDYIWVQFSPDGKRILTASMREVRIWDISPISEACPAWLPQLAEAIAGIHLNEKGVLQRLDEDPINAMDRIREQLSGEHADDDWVIWGKWFLADRSTRTISPFSKITVPEYIENRIKENTPESLDEAERLAVGNAELLKRIAEARQALEKKPKDAGAKSNQ